MTFCFATRSSTSAHTIGTESCNASRKNLAPTGTWSSSTGRQIGNFQIVRTSVLDRWHQVREQLLDKPQAVPSVVGVVEDVEHGPVLAVSAHDDLAQLDPSTLGGSRVGF